MAGQRNSNFVNDTEPIPDKTLSSQENTTNVDGNTSMEATRQPQMSLTTSHLINQNGYTTRAQTQLAQVDSIDSSKQPVEQRTNQFRSMTSHGQKNTKKPMSGPESTKRSNFNIKNKVKLGALVGLQSQQVVGGATTTQKSPFLENEGYNDFLHGTSSAAQKKLLKSNHSTQDAFYQRSKTSKFVVAGQETSQPTTSYHKRRTAGNTQSSLAYSLHGGDKIKDLAHLPLGPNTQRSKSIPRINAKRSISPSNMNNFDSTFQILSGAGANKLTPFPVTLKYQDPSFMLRKPLYQKVTRIDKKSFNIEISHKKLKVYITCIEMDQNRQTHVVDLWKKQAAKIIEQLTGELVEEKRFGCVSKRGIKSLLKVVEWKFNTVVLNFMRINADLRNAPIIV